MQENPNKDTEAYGKVDAPYGVLITPLRFPQLKGIRFLQTRKLQPLYLTLLIASKPIIGADGFISW